MMVHVALFSLAYCWTTPKSSEKDLRMEVTADGHLIEADGERLEVNNSKDSSIGGLKGTCKDITDLHGNSDCVEWSGSEKQFKVKCRDAKAVWENRRRISGRFPLGRSGSVFFSKTGTGDYHDSPGDAGEFLNLKNVMTTGDAKKGKKNAMLAGGFQYRGRSKAEPCIGVLDYWQCINRGGDGTKGSARGILKCKAGAEKMDPSEAFMEMMNSSAWLEGDCNGANCSLMEVDASMRSGNGIACFPASSTVVTQDGPMLLSDVEEMGGVMVETSADFNSIHYDRWLWDVHASMGAAQATVQAEFLSITHRESDRRLRITPDHLLFMSKNGEKPQMSPASKLSVGDTIFARSPEKAVKLIPSTVTGIDVVMDVGVYAPFTWSGRLVVDGVLVSNYAVFSETFDSTFEQHNWLPWERMMNVFNPFRYYYGLELDSIMSRTESVSAHTPIASGTFVSDAVLLVWRLADNFVIYPLGLLAKAMELVKWPDFGRMELKSDKHLPEVCSSLH